MKTKRTTVKWLYQAPTSVVVEVNVEKGFAATGDTNPWTPGGGF